MRSILDKSLASTLIVLISCSKPISNCGASSSVKSGRNGITCAVSYTSLMNDKLNGIKINDVGIPMKEKIRHLNELNSMPLPYLNVMRNRVTINMMDGGITNHPAYANLKGVQPRGWPAGETWDSVAGVGGYDNLGLGDSYENNNARSLAIHEATHSVDSQTGFIKNPEFLAFFNRDKGKPNAKDFNGVYRTSYPEEYLAMAVDEYYCSPATKAQLKEYYPNAYEMVEKIFTKILYASGKAGEPPATTPEPETPTPTPKPTPEEPVKQDPIVDTKPPVSDEPSPDNESTAGGNGGMSDDAIPDVIHKGSKPKASFNSCN